MGIPSATTVSTAASTGTASSSIPIYPPLAPMDLTRPSITSQKQPTRPAPVIEDLPNELILYILALLPLRALIAVRGVSHRWRELVHAAPICPIRRRYLALSVRAAAAGLKEEADASGLCYGARDTKEERRQRIEADEAERAEYLAELASMMVRVPRDLELWVAEWPRRWFIDSSPIAGLKWSATTDVVDVDESWSEVRRAGEDEDEDEEEIRDEGKGLSGPGSGSESGSVRTSRKRQEWSDDDSSDTLSVGDTVSVIDSTTPATTQLADHYSSSSMIPCQVDVDIDLAYEPPAPHDVFPSGWSMLTPLRDGSPWIKCVTLTARGRLRSTSVSSSDGESGNRDTESARTKSLERTLLDDGTILHATRILPAELAWLCGAFSDDTGIGMGMEMQMGEPETQAEDEDEGVGDSVSVSVEVMILCLREGRVYVVDGRKGGEKLVGNVYSVCGSYTMHRDNVLALSWVELLEKDLDEKCRALE